MGSRNMAYTLTGCVYVWTMKVNGRYQFNINLTHISFLSTAITLFLFEHIITPLVYIRNR
jgi:hypothetical protein